MVHKKVPTEVKIAQGESLRNIHFHLNQHFNSHSLAVMYDTRIIVSPHILPAP